MEALIAELRQLKERSDPAHAGIFGAILATAVRLNERWNAQSAGLEALVSALAAQPGIEAAKLHDDFMRIASSDFGDPERMPGEIRDIAAAIRLAVRDRD